MSEAVLSSSRQGKASWNWPVTFAGPTAGNTAFAAWLEQSFTASAGRYFNALDVVPHAWQALAWTA